MQAIMESLGKFENVLTETDLRRAYDRVRAKELRSISRSNIAIAVSFIVIVLLKAWGPLHWVLLSALVTYALFQAFMFRQRNKAAKEYLNGRPDLNQAVEVY